MKQVRKELSKSYGINANDSDSDTEPEIKGGSTAESNQIALKNNEDEKKKQKLSLVRDPKAKQMAMDTGMIAARV